ncbi:hypothetical protein ABPG72_022110 [Tetrahymena utriculariae]
MSFKSSQNKSEQITNIVCPIHENKFLELINIDPLCKQKLFCYECIFEQQYLSQNVLQIKEIFNSSNYQFISKWLRFENPQNKELFSTIFSTSHESAISHFFQETLISFKREINDYIDNQIEKMAVSLKKLEDQNKSLKALYLQHQFQSDLKECLNKSQKDRNKLEEEISELIQKFQSENKKFEEEVFKYAQAYQSEINSQQDIIISFPKNLQKFVESSDSFRYNIPQEIKDKFEDLKMILGSQKISQEMIKKSEYQVCYGDLSFELNKQNELEMINYIDQNCQYYLDLNLLKDDRYEILFETSRAQPEHTVYVGICPLSIINTVYICSYCSHIPLVYNSSSMNLKVDKGIQINNDYQCNHQIKLQVCLNEKICRWKFGENINSIKDWSTIKINEPHFLAFQMYYSNSQILIKQIKKVYQFEVW